MLRLRRISPGSMCIQLGLQGGPKSKPLLIYQLIVLKPIDEATFSLKLNVEQATGVNANKNLLVLNILSIIYSVYDVKCDINYSLYSLYSIICDMSKINVIDKILIKNLGKQKRWGSKKLLKEFPS